MTTIENNTFINNGPVPTINYIYFTISFLDYGVQDVIIRNNNFKNLQYIDPGFFRVTKTTQENFNLVFEDN